MKKLTIVSGIQGAGKTTYIDNLKSNLPKGVEYFDFEQKPRVRDNIVMGEVNPEKVKDFVIGVIDDILMSAFEIMDLLFMVDYYKYNGKSYATHYVIATQIPKSEFPVSFINHPDVEFVELPPPSDRKIVEQKIKDFLYSQATPEVLRAVEYSIKNPSSPSDHPTHNIDSWKIEMTLIPGMVAPKK